MKANIDLTMNRDFSRMRGEPFSRFRGLLKKDFPWSTKHLTSSRELESATELVFTGSKKDRESKRMMYEYENEISCERCGKDINHIPWGKKGWGLCSVCERELDKEHRQERLWGNYVMPINRKKYKRLLEQDSFGINELITIDMQDLDELLS